MVYVNENDKDMTTIEDSNNNNNNNNMTSKSFPHNQATTVVLRLTSEKLPANSSICPTV